MAVVRKFLFDNDFGEAPQSNVGGNVGGAQAKGGASAGGKNASVAPPAPPPPTFTEAEMQGACDIARRKGEEAGAIAPESMPGPRHQLPRHLRGESAGRA